MLTEEQRKTLALIPDEKTRAMVEQMLIEQYHKFMRNKKSVSPVDAVEYIEEVYLALDDGLPTQLKILVGCAEILYQPVVEESRNELKENLEKFDGIELLRIMNHLFKRPGALWATRDRTIENKAPSLNNPGRLTLLLKTLPQENEEEESELDSSLDGLDDLIVSTTEEPEEVTTPMPAPTGRMTRPRSSVGAV